jgi:DNA-binding transcriptional regulator YdaS (Cro superfamily)
MRKRDREDGGIEAAITAAGSISELARKLGLTQPTVARWRQIPVPHVPKIERLYKIPRWQLRPDVWEPPYRPRKPRRPRKTAENKPAG